MIIMMILMPQRFFDTKLSQIQCRHGCGSVVSAFMCLFCSTNYKLASWPPSCSAMSTDEKQPLLPSTSTALGSTKHELPLPHTINAPPSSTDLYGYILMAMSCLGTSGMSLLVHLAEEQFRFPPLSAVFICAVVQTVLSVTYILTFLDVRRMLSNITTRQVYLLAFRGILGACGYVCFFNALQLMPVGDAIAIFYCAPAITMLLSSLVLAEPITFLDVVAVIISFIGVLLISRPGFDVVNISKSDRIIGSLLVFASAFSCSAAFVVVRALGTGIHFMASVFSLGFASMALSTALGGAINPTDFISMKVAAVLVFFASLFAFFGHCCNNKGLQQCRAGPGVLIRNLDVPLSYLLGLLFLGETPSWFSFVGSCLVLFSSLLIGMHQIMKE